MFDYVFDGVLVTPNVPEPSAWMLMATGFGAVGVGMRTRRKIAFNFG